MRKVKAAHQKEKAKKNMPYLNNTELDMKERVILIFHYLKNARTEREATEQIDRLDKLIQSFRNNTKAGKKIWTNKD